MWLLAISLIAGLVLAYSMQPKIETRPPAGINDVQVPTAEVGRPIPVLFGRKRLSGPNIVWYGHLKVDPIKKSGGKK